MEPACAQQRKKEIVYYRRGAIRKYMNDWHHLRSFLAVARTGSLSQAARDMGLAQPTIRRHIEALEQAVGRPLFLRSPQGLTLTDHAATLVASAEMVEGGAAQFSRLAEASEAGGVVRISASQIVAREVLPAILADIARQNPGLRFEIDARDDNADLLRHEADIAIRMVQPTQQDLLAAKVAQVELGLFAHRSWLDTKSVPQTMDDVVATGGLLSFDRDAAQARAWENAVGPLPAHAFALRSDDQSVLLAAMRAGLGMAICQTPVAARDANLVRVLPDIAFHLDIWTACHRDLRQQDRIATVLAGLSAGLKAYAQSA